MDGVLIDSEPLHKQVEQEILTDLGVHLTHDDHIKFAGVGKEMWSTIKNLYGYNRNISEDDLHDMKREIYLKRLTANPIIPIDGVLDIVQFAKKEGLKIAIASSSSQANIKLVAKSIGIYDEVEVAVSGDDVSKTKPSPEIFIKTSNLLGVQPSECVVIEDSANGVKAAKLAGMYCIGFANPNSGAQDLSLANATVEHLSECLNFIKK